MPNGKDKTVLLVDDEASNLQILGQALAGWNLKVAKNGKTALAIAKSSLPDIILLDIILPDIDGFEICKRLKATSATKHIPIIFITAKDSLEDEVYGLELGAIDYIKKPFNPKLIKSKVENHLEYQRTKNELRKLSQAVEQSTVSIVITDTDGVIEYVNPVFTEMTGYSFEEAIGENPRILKTDYHPDSYYKDLWETISAGNEWRGELYNQRNNGQKFWEEAVISPITDERGEIINYIAVKNNISKRKEAEKELLAKNNQLKDTKKMLNDILNLSTEAIRYVDRDYNIVKSNYEYDKLNKLYLENKGISLNEMKTENLKCYDALCTDNCSSSICSLVQVLQGDGLVQRDAEVDFGEDKKYFIVTIAPYKDDQGEIKGFLQSYRDITTRKEKELELEIQKGEVERLYDKLETEFEKGIKLHQQFLPDDLPCVENLSYTAYFNPADRLGGDFYNAIKIGNQLLLYLADVSGHGLDGSMLNIFLRETINNYLLHKDYKREKLSPKELMAYVIDRYNKEDFPADYFICLLLGVLDIESLELTFANAGFQIPPLVVAETGETNSVICRGLPISSALYEKLDLLEYEEKRISLRDKLLFVTTDGLIEEFSEQDDTQYGQARVEKVLSQNYKLTPKLIAKKINQDFKEFSGGLVAQDDITFFILKG